MRTKALLLAASVASVAIAQDLATVLAGQPSLSTLVELLQANPTTTEFLSSQEGVTLFAPSNRALASILQNGGIFNIEDAGTDAGLVEQTLRYHLYRGVIRSTDFNPTPVFVPGYLNYSSVVLDGDVSGSNVTGGQVVSYRLDEGGSPVVISGIKTPSNILVPVSADRS